MKGLYANINRRKRLGISRSKKKSTIASKIYSAMKNKMGGFRINKKGKTD